MKNTEALMTFVRENLIQTGSSLLTGIEHRDIDYFGLYSQELEDKLRKMGARDGGESLNDGWGEQAKFLFEHDGERIDIFLVKKRYFRVLRIYTGLLKKLSFSDAVMRGLLSVKEVRVLLAETLRRVMLDLYEEQDRKKRDKEIG